MRFILKIFVAPVALVITIISLFLTFILAASELFFSIASGIIFLCSIVLFIVGEPVGGATFLVIAFLVSPFGLHALAGKLVGVLDSAGGALRGFLTS